MNYNEIYYKAKEYYDKHKLCSFLFPNKNNRKCEIALAIMCVCENPPKDINRAIKYYEKRYSSSSGFGNDKCVALKIIKKMMEL